MRASAWGDRRRRSNAAVLVASVLAGALTISAGACSLTNEVGPFDNGACPSSTKACNNRCVPDTFPSVGCQLPGCTPCDLPNAVATCSLSGTCLVHTCSVDFADCNGVSSDGCESDIEHDPANCGMCGCRCGTGESAGCPHGQAVGVIDHGTAGCRAGVCSVGACDPGWGDCNLDPSDGCETQTDSGAACGICGNVCVGSTQCVCGVQDGRSGCRCAGLDGGSD